MNYDLEERVEKFGERTLIFLKSIQYDSLSSTIINQLSRSALSIGANYMEANNASSGRDFRNKIFICKKEAQETKHWLRMMSVLECGKKEVLDALKDETHQLLMIFQRIGKTMDNKSEN